MRALKVIVIGVLGMLALAGVVMAGGQLGAGHGRVDFFVHKARYAALVDALEQHGIQPGERARFRVQQIDDPSTLQPLAADEVIERGRGAGCIWASRDEGGALSVWIETLDLGHAGEYGYAWSRAGTPRSPEVWSERWTGYTALSGGWWMVRYDLG